MLELNKLYHMDCMEAMRDIPDKYFELAIVSYGIKPFGGTLYIREVTRSRFKRRIIRHKHAVNLRNVNSSLSRYLGLIRNCLAKLKNLRIVLYSLFVMVRTAQGINAKIKRFRHISIKQISHLASIKAHKRKIKGGGVMQFEITDINGINHSFDTHVGSASSLIACHNMGFDFMGFEIDADYHRMATERLEAVRAQMRLY